MAKPKRGRSTAAIDDHVGARIRERRIMLGLTQQQLAELIGVTYQQAHKYERGINRVSAGRLFEIARVLNPRVPSAGPNWPNPVSQPRQSSRQVSGPVARVEAIAQPQQGRPFALSL